MRVDDLTHATVGRYRVGGQLQLLPYATIHQAVSVDRARPVLLWTFRDPYASAAGFLETLQRLAGDRRVEQLPGLLKVLEIGQQELAFPVVYAATESAPGGFLLSLLQHGRAPGVFSLTGPLAQTLDQLHQLGLVHGDVQPAMVAVRAEHQPALGGYAMRSVVNRLTPQTNPDGRRSAFRPPGIPGGEASADTDRYGLAAIVYYLLVGQPPGIDGDVVPPSQLRPELPQRVDRAVLRALAPDPADRFNSASEFFQALRGPAGPAAAPAPRAQATAASAPPPSVARPAPGPVPVPAAPAAQLTPASLRDSFLAGGQETGPPPGYLGPPSPASTQLIPVYPLGPEPKPRARTGVWLMAVLVAVAVVALILAATGRISL